ncbi:MAG: UDP-4-amino-4,6-dideoxy-N-acetyl-beta-L-altrosamine transaminase [Helicobacteraceae bacterium]|nr:UDP-4-amino-4,6-dideoxy-N-acetyl-beta-L-altrosamine transaminase [Helicobacteraceae bacterium]
MIPYSRQDINEADIEEVVKVLRSSHLTQGAKVEEFEESITNYLDVKYAVTFNSATSALHASYLSADLCEDDEVITTPISFVATSNMLIEVGAKPIWCDIKLDGNIDERLIQKLITSKTKAIVSVDFAGKSVEQEKIKAIAKENNLIFIDDASHAFGSEFNSKKVGSFADMTIFSFHAIKPFTTGEGGCVVTDNKEYYEKLKLIRSHGVIKKEGYSFDMTQIGYNYRLTEFAAALGLSQLKRIDEFITKRDVIAKYYDQAFKHEKLFSTIKISENLKSSHHLYPILLDHSLHCEKELIFKELQAEGIGVQVHYKPIYENSFYKTKFGNTRCQSANDFYRCELSIPCHQQMSLDDAEYVANKLLEVLKQHSK